MFGYFQSEEKHLIFTFNKPFCLVSFSDSFPRAGIYGKSTDVYYQIKMTGLTNTKIKTIFMLETIYTSDFCLSTIQKNSLTFWGGALFLGRGGPFCNHIASLRTLALGTISTTLSQNSWKMLP